MKLNSIKYMTFSVSSWEICERNGQKPTALNNKQLQHKLTLANIGVTSIHSLSRVMSSWNRKVCARHKQTGTSDKQFIQSAASLFLWPYTINRTCLAENKFHSKLLNNLSKISQIWFVMAAIKNAWFWSKFPQKLWCNLLSSAWFFAIKLWELTEIASGFLHPVFYSIFTWMSTTIWHATLLGLVLMMGPHFQKPILCFDELKGR